MSSDNRLGITDGPFGWGLDVRFCDDRFKHSVSFGNGHTIILLHQADWPVDDDVKRFIADAFNIFSRTGKLPSELEAQALAYATRLEDTANRLRVVEDELAALKRQRDELRDLFFTYSGHKDGCEVDLEMVACSCGFSEAYAKVATTKDKP